MVKSVGSRPVRDPDAARQPEQSATARGDRGAPLPAIGSGPLGPRGGWPVGDTHDAGFARRAKLPVPGGASTTPAASSGTEPPAAGASASAAGAPQPAAGGERDPLSAQRVFDILAHSDRARAGDFGRTGKSWISPTEWGNKSLINRLIRYPDYPQWRARLEPVVHELGLLPRGEALPEPAKAREIFDAQALVDALTRSRDQQRAWRARNPGKAMTSRLGVKSSGVTKKWVRGDGTLLKPPNKVAALPGYGDLQGAIRGLLGELGHGDMAAALPASASGIQDRVQAATIAQVLAALQADPQRSLLSVANEIGLTVSTLDKYVAKDGTIRKPEILRAMPDYPAYAEQIRASQRALQITPQAAANDFMDKCDARLAQVAVAARLLREDASMEVSAAARAASVSESLTRTLVDDRGAIRDASQVRRIIGGFDEVASKRLESLLARLGARLEPGAGSSSAGAAGTSQGAPMKEILLKGAGTAPDRMLVLASDTTDPGTGTRGRLGTLYAQNPSLVQGPRSYEPDRHRQPLRWLSTLIAQQFPTAIEVQCHYEARTRTIMVSSNLSGVNADIEKFLAGRGLDRLLSEAATPGLPLAPDASREDRHHAKLSTRLDPASDPHPTPLSDEILAAIAEKRFAVPRRSYVFDKRQTNLHAERRLANFARDAFDTKLAIDQLAGTMRPCGTCADAIGTPDDAHRGPYWLSKAARAGVDGRADIQRAAGAGRGSSVTRSRDGGLTFDHDTDSDSDA
jgi:hypothetical protein